jgi:hypothetical protein
MVAAAALDKLPAVVPKGTHTMADRFSMRHGATGHDDVERPEQRRSESDPLAELARLIGQSDPMAEFPRDDRAPLSPRHAAEPHSGYSHSDYAGSDYSQSDYSDHAAQPVYQPQPDGRDDQPSGPPNWVQHRAGWRRATPVVPEPVAQPEAGGYDEAAYHHDDPSRYDEALYGHAGPALVEDAPYLAEGAYRDDAYGYDEAYEGYGEADQGEEPRRGKKLAVLAILALAVVGTGGAYAYRSLHGVASAPVEPPVIKAETAPVKVVPPTQAAERKLVQDRLASAGGTERLVSREETPVDVTSKTQGEPRIVFPPLTRNAAPATVAAAASGASSQPASATPGAEPRKIRTVAVRPDQPAPATAAPAAPAPRAANPPVALALDSQTRTASINPAAEIPVTSGGYLVQVSSQRSDADARASFRVLQGKFPSVLGNHAPVIKRADLGAKGVHYRAMVGPFGSQDQAAQFCGNLKTAGGQCFVQRN